MHESTKQIYRYRGFSAAEIVRVSQRIKQLPNALAPKSDRDQRMWTALQKMYAGQDITESVAEIRSQI